MSNDVSLVSSKENPVSVVSHWLMRQVAKETYIHNVCYIHIKDVRWVHSSYYQRTLREFLVYLKRDFIVSIFKRKTKPLSNQVLRVIAFTHQIGRYLKPKQANDTIWNKKIIINNFNISNLNESLFLYELEHRSIDIRYIISNDSILIINKLLNSIDQ